MRRLQDVCFPKLLAREEGKQSQAPGAMLLGIQVEEP